MAGDLPLDRAGAQIRTMRQSPALAIASFFDEASSSVSYVVHDRNTLKAAIIDSVLDFDVASGRIGTAAADALVQHVRSERLTVEWLLETHAHADHLSAAFYLQRSVGGVLAIGRDIVRVQAEFAKILNVGSDFACDGSEFDRLFDDGDVFAIGNVPAIVLHVPGHTPADIAYVIGDVVFTGDTLLMADYGSARTDFPGGDARELYRSIRRLLRLPDRTRLFLCHDYLAGGRDSHVWETTVGAQRVDNIHVHEGVSEAEFVSMRTARDVSLPMPRLLFPAVQINMRGGQLPEPENNGRSYLKIPLNTI